MNSDNYIPYTGTTLNAWKEDVSFNERIRKEDIEAWVSETAKLSDGAKKPKPIPPYLPDPALIKAIEYARIVKRPLLLRGEPGCGKTKAAQALAFELYANIEKDNYRKHYFEWFIKSTTKARDGLYMFDHLARLRDVSSPSSGGNDGKDPKRYREFGPLGKAFLASKKDSPSVLLIDEIDKASLDFPNDLLLELDEKRFFIPETREEIIAEEAPIVIITSNDEKELPKAFLRRCVFHYLDFPDPGILQDIAKRRLENKNIRQELVESNEKFKEDLIPKVTELFYKIRNKMQKSPNTDKLPSTSEFIDWLEVIHYHYLQAALTDDEFVWKDHEPIYPELLFKTLDDRKYSKDTY